jgi:hypothetical protein
MWIWGVIRIRVHIRSRSCAPRRRSWRRRSSSRGRGQCIGLIVVDINGEFKFKEV